MSATENAAKRRRLEAINAIMAPADNPASLSAPTLVPSAAPDASSPTVTVIFPLPPGMDRAEQAAAAADDAWNGDIEDVEAATLALGAWTTLNTVVQDIDGVLHAARTFTLPDRASSPDAHAAMVRDLTDVLSSDDNWQSGFSPLFRVSYTPPGRPHQPLDLRAQHLHPRAPRQGVRARALMRRGDGRRQRGHRHLRSRAGLPRPAQGTVPQPSGAVGSFDPILV